MAQIPASTPPIIQSPSPIQWARKNLFSTWYNSILTIICLLLIFLVLKTFILWVLTQAQWNVVEANLRLLFVGRYPQELYWRVWVTLGIISSITGISWGFFQKNSPIWSKTNLFSLGILAVAIVFIPIDLTARLWILGVILVGVASYSAGRTITPQIGSWLPLAWGICFLIVFWFIKGGLGLKETETNLWNGLLLTLLTAVISIALSFPIGVLLALGRQSSLPVIRWLSILYIEVIRGLPLIGILFLAQVMLPLFLPPEFPKMDRVVRAIAGLVLFSAAYLAENVRGGLQSIPRGQSEAAKALGLSTPLVILLIVLPQALKAVIPAIVGQFIGLFKDTSLLALFGLLELTGIARSVVAQPQFLGRHAEVYLFIGLIYWAFCYAMSVVSINLEKQLNVGRR
jgi:general L-amino acid transport system permease protein